MDELYVKEMSDGVLKIKIEESNKVIKTDDGIIFDGNDALTSLLSNYEINTFNLLNELYTTNGLVYKKYYNGFVYVYCDSEDDMKKLVNKLKIIVPSYIDCTMTYEKLKKYGLMK